MDTPTWTSRPPKTIVLATDLSSRCDRALDRAAELAARWHARLLIVHAIDPHEGTLERRHLTDLPSWRRPPGRTRLVEAQIRRDLRAQLAHVEVRVEEGDPADVIQRVAAESSCELVVTGIARDETLGRYFLGTTVERLVRRSPVPILVVKSRGPYREVIVATDFSPSSAHALKAAAVFFPDAPLALIHAFETPFAGFLDRDKYSAVFKAMQEEASAAFLADPAFATHRPRIKVLIEHGAPASVIRSYMEDNGANLVVAGTHGRSAAFDVLIGSTAKRILDHAPGDVLLIREPRAVNVD